jgi:hypothetical protein
MASVGPGPSEDNPADNPRAETSMESELGASIPVDFIQGRGHVQDRESIREYTQIPREAFRPYVAPPVTRRRRSDWPILVFALVAAAVVMAGFCIAGFAVYVQHGGNFP